MERFYQKLFSRPACLPSAFTHQSGGVLRGVDLGVGNVLLLRSGKEAAITGLVVRHDLLPVYNFHVEELHCYAVGHARILVHNHSFKKSSFATFSGKLSFCQSLRQGATELGGDIFGVNDADR